MLLLFLACFQHNDSIVQFALCSFDFRSQIFVGHREKSELEKSSPDKSPLHSQVCHEAITR